MCDFSGRLIAWLDHELGEAEAADVERHVRACRDCRKCVTAYKGVSSTFEAYCEATMRAQERRGAAHLATVVWGAAAAVAVAVVAVLFAFPERRVEWLAVHGPVVAASPAVLAGGVPGSKEPKVKVRRRHPAAAGPAQKQNAQWQAEDPAIQIAIPAEAIFPPGAFPEGVNFVADLNVAADGSAQQLRVQPRLARLEGRLNQP